MRLFEMRRRPGRLPYLAIFLAGFVAGIVIMNTARKALLDDTGLLDEYALYHMKYMTVDSRALFFYVLGDRLKSVAVLAVMATTYLGLAVVCGALAWYGASAGMFLSALVIRYGMKGILFALTGVFPQYLLYVPAVIFLIVWCEQICRGIYFRNTSMSEGNTAALPKRLLQLGVVVLIVIIGCLLESYVNPFLLSGLLKIF